MKELKKKIKKELKNQLATKPFLQIPQNWNGKAQKENLAIWNTKDQLVTSD